MTERFNMVSEMDNWISPSIWRAWRTGKRSPQFKHLRALSNALKQRSIVFLLEEANRLSQGSIGVIAMTVGQLPKR